MPESQHGLPSKGGGGIVVVIGILMLLVAGGLVFWKMKSGEPEPEVEEIKTPAPAKTAEAAPVLDNAPPPPPTEEEIEEEEKQEKASASPVKAPAGPAGCGGTCSGSAGAALRSALATRGASSKSCYNTALRRNAMLEGKMTVNVRLSPSGAVCSVGVANNTLGDAAVTSCVVAKFRSAPFPAPDGGCVDTAVPLNFTSNK